MCSTGLPLGSACTMGPCHRWTSPQNCTILHPNCSRLCQLQGRKRLCIPMQAEPDRRWQSRIKIRIRGSQHAGYGIGNVEARSAIAREEQTVPAVQQMQAATSSSHGLSTQSIPRSWQRPDPTQGSQAAGSRSDKTISQLRSSTKGSSLAQNDLPSAAEALSGQSSRKRNEEGQEDRLGSAVGSGSTAPFLSPAQGHAPGTAGFSALGQSPPTESPQLEEEASVQGAVSLAGAWNAALNQARAPSAFAAIPEEPTAAMLQYAAAPAPLPPAGMTCEAWLAQADQRRCISASHALSWVEAFIDHCILALLTQMPWTASWCAHKAIGSSFCAAELWHQYLWV